MRKLVLDSLAGYVGSKEIANEQLGGLHRAAQYLRMLLPELQARLGTPHAQRSDKLKPSQGIKDLKFIATPLGWTLDRESLAKLPSVVYSVTPTEMQLEREIQSKVLVFGIPASCSPKSTILGPTISKLPEPNIVSVQKSLTQLGSLPVELRYISSKGEVVQKTIAADQIHLSQNIEDPGLQVKLEIPASKALQKKYPHTTTETITGLRALAIWQ